MLQRIKITTEHDTHFKECWKLYIDAFPPQERRNLDYHLETLKYDQFHFEAILDSGKFVGIIGWWRFGSSRFIEHLATLPTVRDKGYGGRILDEFVGEECTPLILEVEHPTCELSRRRIGFYQRHGLVLNSYDYSHPPYDTEQSEFVELLLMSHPAALSSQKYQSFKKECYTKVHFRHLPTE